jgi:hypothetical protein
MLAMAFTQFVHFAIATLADEQVDKERFLIIYLLPN